MYSIYLFIYLFIYFYFIIIFLSPSIVYAVLGVFLLKH